MRRVTLVIFISSLVATPAMAQTWAQQQEMYNAKANLETELYQQREEMQRIRQENNRALEEQRREIDQQQYELQKLRRDSQSKQWTPDIDTQASTRLENQKLLREIDKQQRDAETRAFVENAMPNSALRFDDKYAARFADKLSDMGISRQDIESLEYASKAMMLRVENAAKKGSAEDQRKLATAYWDGAPIKQDHAEAIRWFKSAAENGDAEAQAQLGYLYGEGVEVSKDEKLSAQWYMKAAQQGLPKAQFAVGGYYLLGKGLPQDDQKSYDWFKKAADRGNGNAQYALGLRYYDGSRLPKDDVEAAYWFMLARINKTEYLTSEGNQKLVDNTIKQLSPEQRAKVEKRVANWEPIRTKDEQDSFNRANKDKENFIISSLRNQHFSEEQAKTILAAHKRYLFQGGKARSYTAAQMRDLFDRTKAALAKQAAGDNRYEGATRHLVAELGQK